MKEFGLSVWFCGRQLLLAISPVSQSCHSLLVQSWEITLIECSLPLLRLMGVMCLCQWESRPLKIFLVDLVETQLMFIIALFWAIGCLISGMLTMFSALLYWT